MPLRMILAVRVRRGLIVDFVDPTSGIEDRVIFEKNWKDELVRDLQKAG